ncbi:MAG: AAA family ATPase [Bacilli bacterium]|nr:AAA family ATPase [Bacilli bacterium]
MNKLVAIVGMAGSGKSRLCEYFENIGYKKVYFGGITMEKLKEANLDITQDNERFMREKLRKEYGMAAYAILSIPKIDEYIKENNVIIDGLYSWDELKILKEKYPDLIIVAVIVDKKIRYQRLNIRDIRPLSNEEATNRDIKELENLSKGGPIAYADYFVMNNGTEEEYMNNIKKLVKEL